LDYRKVYGIIFKNFLSKTCHKLKLNFWKSNRINIIFLVHKTNSIWHLCVDHEPHQPCARCGIQFATRWLLMGKFSLSWLEY